jgi:polysaccharide chain length determinant protein (PEP-CTERM system associated)
MSRQTSTDPASTIRSRAQQLSRRRNIALAAALTVLCAGVPFVLMVPPLYQATATVLIEDPLPGLGSERAAETESRLQAIQQEALSRTRLLGLAERFDLYPGLRGQVPSEVLLDRLQQDIRMDVNSSTGPQPASAVSFTLSYTGLGRESAAAVANALASFFVERSDSLRTFESSQTTKYLADQIAETRKRLDAQAQRVKDYASRNSGAMPQQMLATISTIERYNLQLQQNADERLKLNERRQDLQARLADLTTRGPDPVLDPAGASLAAKRKDLAALLGSGATDLHPDVKTLRSEIGELERQADRGRRAGPASGTSPRATLEQSLKETNARLQELEGQRASFQGSIRSLDRSIAGAAVREPDIQQLNRDFAATRDSLDTLQRQYDQARLAERATTGHQAQAFRIVDPAVAPGGSVGPNRLRLLFVLAVLALVCGVGAALLADRLDTSFGSIDELRAFTRVPVLASIPQISTRRDTRAKWARGLAAVTASAVVLAAVAAAAVHVASGNELLARLLLRMG